LLIATWKWTDCSGRNKGQKLVGYFFKIIYLFVGYWLPFYWKCTVKLGNQNEFWSAKCWNWSENGQWPIVISNTGLNRTVLKNWFNNVIYVALYYIYIINELMLFLHYVKCAHSMYEMQCLTLVLRMHIACFVWLLC